MSTVDQLDAVVEAWRSYAESRPENIDVRDVLVKRDLNMYRGLGINNVKRLSEKLVEDRSIASLEMTMGHLYERVLESLGARKMTNDEKSRPGNKGIDFIHDTPSEHRLVNLKAGLSTANGDISSATVNNLSIAKEHWELNNKADDNPLKHPSVECVMVRAIARGPSKRQTTPQGILWLVGDAMWDYFGGGTDLLLKLGDALARNPIEYPVYTGEIEYAVARMDKILSHYELPGQEVDWDRLIRQFP